ncbi:MAG TPA: PEGA domain-containing protein [Gemmatimonadaceae bacterium]
MTATPVGSGDGDHELLRAVRDAAAGSYDVLGELGRVANGCVIYLARDTKALSLVALRLDGANDEYSLKVARTLDAGLANVGASACGRCGAPLVGWGKFCPQCGADMAGLASGGGQSRTELLSAVQDAARGAYEILGEMDRANGGGAVYFARDVASGRLVTLRLRQEGDRVGDRGPQSYSLGVTKVIEPLVTSLGGGTMATRSALVPPPEIPLPPLLVQPTAQRHTPQEVLLPADQLPVDETLPMRPAAPVPPWVVVLGATAVVALLAAAVFVHARLTAPDATGSNAVVAKAGAGSTAAVPATARIDLAAPLPRGAHVTVDGIAWRPPQVALPPGSYSLGADAPGYTPFRETRTLAAGETLSWSPALVAVRAELPKAQARTAKAAPPKGNGPRAPAGAATSLAPVAAPAPTCQSAFDAKDWAAAVAACGRDAHAGDATAERNLGVMYQQGYSVAKDPAQAAMWFQKAADGGNREAAYQLAIMYDAGRGVAKDARQATAWYRKAALLGDVDAQVRVGMAYENGAGVDVNSSEAVTWYRKAADQGNAWAQNRLGWLYGMGKGISRDDGQAMKYFRAAADQGNAQAEYNVGFMYDNGRGVPRDDAQAVSWYRKAAAQGYADAQKALKQHGLTQ